MDIRWFFEPQRAAGGIIEPVICCIPVYHQADTDYILFCLQEKPGNRGEKRNIYVVKKG